MTNENNKDPKKKVEVIDPSDLRYKDDDYFKSNPNTNGYHQFEDEEMIRKTYSYGCTHTGCGCTIGCFSIMFISFLLSLLVYWLF
ncbi:hypothetical protein [Staphylococcus capitis]|uniref:hypothetical protein n=1 Tax=Staphylococcus capitis TaxID=29388 RepID=UPI0034CF6381